MTTPFDTAAFVIADYVGAAPSVYLDTNAWSLLAKNHNLVSPLAAWLRRNNLHPILSRFQIVELSAADFSLFEGLADAVTALEPIMVDRGQHEFTGEKFHFVKRDLLLPLRLNTAELRHAFIDELMSSTSLANARRVLAEDAQMFGISVQAQLDRRPTDKRRWKEFPASLTAWLNEQCRRNHVCLHPDGINDKTRYVGLKLSYALLYWRYVIHPQRWHGTNDYVDYLHVGDMPYSSVVITEQNIAEGLRQVRMKTDLLVPEEVHTTDWLSELAD